MVRFGSVIGCATLAGAGPLSARKQMVTRARPAELRSKANRALFDRGRMTLAIAVQCEIGDGDPGAIRTRDPQLRRLTRKRT